MATKLAAGSWQTMDTAPGPATSPEPGDTRDFLAIFEPGGRQLVVHWSLERLAYVAGTDEPVHPTAWQELPDPPVPVAPVLTSLVPDTAALGDADVTLHVHGTGFLPNAVIDWNGTTEPTTVVSPTELTTLIAMATAEVALDVPVTVRNGDGPVSNALTFTLTDPAARDRDQERDRSKSRSGPSGPSGPSHKR